MIDFFQSLDQALFYFCNRTLQNPLFDALMPFITDLNKNALVVGVVVILWLVLLAKGGTNGGLAAILLIPTIVFSDQLNSSFLKFIIERPRPCGTLTDVHLLVSCGSGYSFPSSHAVNNFAGALLLSYFLPRWTWAFFLFASTVAFSRMYVGVHYPADVVAGAVIGLLCATTIILLFCLVESWWKEWRVKEVAAL